MSNPTGTLERAAPTHAVAIRALYQRAMDGWNVGSGARAGLDSDPRGGPTRRGMAAACIPEHPCPPIGRNPVGTLISLGSDWLWKALRAGK